MSAGLVVAACALVTMTPWWCVRAGAERRARFAARTGPVVAAEPEESGAVEIGVLLELLAAAVRAGSSLPRALGAVGSAIGGPDGAALGRVGAALVLGSSWDAAWTGASPRLDVVRRALRPAWLHGAAPAQSLRTAGVALRQDRVAAARTASARLGVHLVLPLGACFLPAFVLLGLLPVLLSLGAGMLG
ncbi:type II secretion system F family protein [Cellulosimicrobium arenosum]|uniref:Type II secretion system F family protein n=1 Tax=Cellulosimicrobium arenosum TaxID=2708133 RepID=A0A927G8I9_9MICO|nr:type II secretion system F family protein [Cellulosimicrobium arenosum]MBD8078884.1 type II secretion system F family protein [Cellulosimicrobium arenosum]